MASNLQPVEPSSYCAEKWNEAIEVVRRDLSAQDQESLDQIKTSDDLVKSLVELQNTSQYKLRQSLVQKVAPSLVPLRGFLTLLAASLGNSTIQTALVWGVLTLVIAAAGSTETLLPSTLDMIADLAHNLEMFRIYEPTFARNEDLGNNLMDIFVDMITFWVQVVPFLRRHRYDTKTSRTGWNDVQKLFKETLQHIRKRCDQIKEKAEALIATAIQPAKAADLLSELDRLGLLPPTSATSEESSIFPCNNIPFAPNPYFSCRENEIRGVREHLDITLSDAQFRSFALYGNGGIGKTQTALSFAYEQVAKGVQAILWIDCETGLSLARSFYYVAEMLQLQGLSQDENSDQNRFLVLKWLRRTSASWLIVMDNVEDLNLIRNAWPTASHGAALVTSRKSIVSIDPAAGGLEIKVFHDRQGSELILKMIGRSSYPEEEVKAAELLSARLGGLALALAVMASQIRLRGTSIQDFLALYMKYPERLNKERRGVEQYYKLSIESCWKSTFEFLSEDASNLLAIIAFMAPDNIPTATFNQPKSPPELSFCSDEWSFNAALDQLISISLIRRNPSSSMLYIHRLTQEAYRYYMDADRHRRFWLLTAQLLNDAFPKLVNGLSMRPSWPTCKRYIAHVLILCARFQEAKFSSESPQLFDPFLELSTGCGWYLMESGAWSEELELMATALPLCSDHESLMYANLTNSLGEMEVERGHVDRAHELMGQSLEIRQKLLPPIHEEVANGLNNYGNIVLQRNEPGDLERSIQYYRDCIEINMQLPRSHSDKFLHIPHTNIARALRVLGDYRGSIENAEKSRDYSIKFLGRGNHFHGLGEYHIGNAHFDQGNFDEAERRWQTAVKYFMRENETHPSTVAAKLKLSCIKMKRGQYDEAITDLQQLLVIAKLNEPSKGDRGETARVTRKMAEAYEMKGDNGNATELRDSAEAMRQEIQGARFSRLGDNDLSYAMMSFHAFW